MPFAIVVLTPAQICAGNLRITHSDLQSIHNDDVVQCDESLSAKSLPYVFGLYDCCV